MTDLTLFETERLVLSGWRADQIDDLIRLHGDPTVARFLTPHGQPWSREQMEKSLQHWIDLFASRRLGEPRHAKVRWRAGRARRFRNLSPW